MSDSVYKPLIDSMQWSYSRIKLFDTCRYAWYLKYLYGDKEEQNFYASYGKYIHNLIERYYRDEISHQDLSMTYLMGFYYTVEGVRPRQEIVDKYMDAGLAYFQNFKPFPYSLVSVEEKIEFNINNYQFVGFVDYIGMDGDELVIVDHKSRDLKQRSRRKKPTLKDAELDEFLKQLYLYAVGIEQRFGKLPKKLCFNCFKSGEFIEEEFNKIAFENAKGWAVDSIKKIETADKFYPNIDWFYCTNLCGYKGQCPYYEIAFGGCTK